MYGVEKALELADEVDRLEAIEAEAQVRWAIAGENQREVEKQYDACKRRIEKAGTRAYWDCRKRLQEEVVEHKAERKRLLQKKVSYYAKMQNLKYATMSNLKDRGDLEAANGYKQYALRCDDSARLLGELVEAIELRLKRMRPPKTNFVNWLPEGDELREQYEALRVRLKEVRRAAAQAKADCMAAEAAAKAAYEELLKELERYDASREAERAEEGRLRLTDLYKEARQMLAKVTSGGGVIPEEKLGGVGG